MILKRRKLVGLVVGLVCLVGFALAYLYSASKDERSCEGYGAPFLSVTVARTPVRAGEMLRPSNVTFETMPHRFLPPNPVYEEEVSNLLGKRVKVDLKVGALLLHSDFEHATKK